MESFERASRRPRDRGLGNNIEIANGDGTSSLVDDTDFGGVNTDGRRGGAATSSLTTGAPRTWTSGPSV